MTFLEHYQNEQTWFGRVLIMEVFHLAMSSSDDGWTVANTANEFKVSIGLTSENLKIARESHINPTILNCDSRQQALDKLKK